MALLKKAALLGRFEDAVRLSGWNLLFLTNGHPAGYQVFRDGRGGKVKVYIWNITPGGRKTLPDEYRIQITGFDHFTPEPNGRTLILGWWEDVGVFAGWDYRYHMGALGSSPSMQVSRDALKQALLTGFAPYVNQKGETAIAFRQDFTGTYIEFLEPLHDSGTIPAEAALLTKLSEDPDVVTDEEIDDEVDDEDRKYAIMRTKRALRASDFALRVLTAYEQRCAMCDMQLRLIDGAHILPVEHEGSDQTRNGIALCPLHHRAYDRGLITFDPNFNVFVNKLMVKQLRDDDLAGGLDKFREALRPIIRIPPDKKDRPGKSYINRANKLRGWLL